MTIPVFPTLHYLMPVKRTPIWSTLKQKSISGQETRLGLWSYPQWRYELQYETLRSSAAYNEFQSLVGLYNQVGGSASVFSYTDPYDNSATAQQIGVGDGTTTRFQLVRTLGGFVESVFAPTSVAISETISGTTTVIASTAYTVGTTGAVTFAAAPAAGAVIDWTGTFAWLCRFDDDTLDFQQDYASFWSAKSVKFSTVKL